MPRFDVIFIVLTYREGKDLVDFIKSVQKKVYFKYKIIVVNSYYDDISLEVIESIANEHNCDFINVPNKGYGAGNNIGIQFAKDNYEYNFLVICNPDTEILKFDYNDIKGKENYIIGPNIITLNKNNQNPFRLINSKFFDTVKYYAFKYNKHKLIYIDIIVNKIVKTYNRIVNKIIGRHEYPIYSCHGSFIILGKNAINLMGKIYNEKMFLFAEEDHLAKVALNKNIVTLANHNIHVLHKEDGSVKFLDDKVLDLIGESYIEYYSYWYDKTK